MIFNEEVNIVIDNTYCRYYLYDIAKPLVVTFAPAGSLVQSSNINENPSIWGYDFIKKEGLNIISFAAIDKNHWYLSEILHGFLRSVGKKTQMFQNKLGYGASMGAYAVSAYSDALSLSDLLLFSPISTLNPKIVNFDKNHYIDEQAWENLSLDGSKSNSSGYLLYDPLFTADNKHAGRYNTKMEHLRVPGLGHFVIKGMAELGILPWIFRSFVAGKINKEMFFEKVRKRRILMDYYNNMLHVAERKKHILALRIIEEYRQKNLNAVEFNKYNKLNPDHVDCLRDLAVYFEDKDLEKSYFLMSLAYDFRPKGPFIKKKYFEYKNILKNQKVENER